MPGRGDSPGYGTGSRGLAGNESEIFQEWPNITRKIDAMPGADDLQQVQGKFEKFFSPAPGKGD